MAKTKLKNLGLFFSNLLKKLKSLNREEKPDSEQKTGRLFFYRKSEEPTEFKLFNLIEDALVGLCGFLERMIRTMFLVLQPRKIWRNLDIPQKESPLARPFTFLALGNFLLSAQYLNTLPVYNSEDLLRTFLNLSIQNMLAVLVPGLFVILAFALVLAILFSAIIKEESKSVLYIICYCIGFQQYTFYAFLIYVNSFEDWFEPLLTALDNFWFLLLLGLLAYRPLLHKLNISKKWLGHVLKFIVSILLFTVVIYLIVSINDSSNRIGWSFAVAEKLPPVEARITELNANDGTFEATVVLANKLSNTIFIKKNPGYLGFYLHRDSADNIGSKSKSSGYKITRWQDLGTNLLAIPQKDHKWMQIQLSLTKEELYGLVDEYTTDATASDLKLTIIDPGEEKQSSIEYSIEVPLSDLLIDMSRSGWQGNL